jgi:hypothetical protein
MIYEMYLLYTPFTSPSDSQVDVESVFATIAKIQVVSSPPFSLSSPTTLTLERTHHFPERH